MSESSSQSPFPWRWVIVIVALGVALVSFLVWDAYLRNRGVIVCDDGKRRLIDTREFETKYWAYNILLEASLSDTQKLTAKLEPKQLEELSESLKYANEFRKFLVHSFNACAVNKAAYFDYEAKFVQLDALARQINELAGQHEIRLGANDLLAKLTKQYVDVSNQLAQEK